ncbi:hypothetical protein SOVF_021240, partial [Spinacia oleracea]
WSNLRSKIAPLVLKISTIKFIVGILQLCEFFELLGVQ